MQFGDEGGGGGARVNAKLGVDVFEMLAHGQRRYPEPLGDLCVRPALRNEFENLPLARRKSRHPPSFLEDERALDEFDQERLAPGIDT